jgi:hypothetical protein
VGGCAVVRRSGEFAKSHTQMCYLSHDEAVSGVTNLADKKIFRLHEDRASRCPGAEGGGSKRDASSRTRKNKRSTYSKVDRRGPALLNYAKWPTTLSKSNCEGKPFEKPFNFDVAQTVLAYKLLILLVPVAGIEPATY